MNRNLILTFPLEGGELECGWNHYHRRVIYRTVIHDMPVV